MASKKKPTTPKVHKPRIFRMRSGMHSRALGLEFVPKRKKRTHK